MPDGVRTRNNKKQRSITFIIHRVIHSSLRFEDTLKLRHALFLGADRCENSAMTSRGVDNKGV